MFRWLVAAVLSLLALASVILILGYILQTNEQNTTQLAEQLATQKAQRRGAEQLVNQYSPEQQAALSRNTALSTKPSYRSNDSQRLVNNDDQLAKVVAQAKRRQALQAAQQQEQQIILNNLTCSSSSQCRVVTVNFIEHDSCVVAINLIGASLLSKYVKQQQLATKNCHSALALEAVCQSNLCQLAPLP